MGKLIVNWLFYKGDKYFYSNDKFKPGINYLVGDNENGKSTFTYLIVYALGLNVTFFDADSDEPIGEIVGDSNNAVEIGVTINSIEYVIRRKIGQSIVTIYAPDSDSHTTYSLVRNGYVFKKEDKTFSDWMFEKLGIEKIEITQNSSTHRINFEDLMRFIYYDQITDNRQVISEFGIRSSDFFRNSSIMKRSIFELLMSGYNEKYYKLYFLLKDLTKKLQDEKEKLNSLEIIQKNIQKQTGLINSEGLQAKHSALKNEIHRLENAREEVKKDGSFNEEVLDRLTELQRRNVALSHKITNLEFELSNLEEDLIKSRRVYEDTKSDIEHIDKILFTSQFIDIISEDKCPFCYEPIDIKEGHCLCGSNKNLDFSRFIYSDKEYLEIMKNKIKTMETIAETVEYNQIEFYHLELQLNKTRDDLAQNMNSIRQITKDLQFNSNAGTIDEITNNINELKKQEMELDLLLEKNTDIKKIMAEIAGLEKKIAFNRNELSILEEQKEKSLQKNIDTFEEIYTEYINDYYADENKHIEVKLDRNYLPIFGEYKHQSFNVAKRLFYHLTMLKMSLDTTNEISYPRLLIIDTMKDEGIELHKLKKLFTYFDDFKDKNCQLIITCGIDEYSKELEPFVIDHLSDEEKLLKETN